MASTYRERNPERQRARAEEERRAFYGLTPEAYDALVLLAQGRCVLCDQQDENTKRTRLHLDHDHATGLSRGLVCPRCNNLIRDIERGLPVRHGNGPEWVARLQAHVGRTIA